MSSIGEDVPKFWLKKASTALLKLCIKTLDENFEKRTAPGSVPDLSYWEQPQGLYTGKQKMKTYLEIHKYLDDQINGADAVRVTLTDGEYVVNGALGYQLRQELEKQFGKQIQDACPVGTMIRLEEGCLNFPGVCFESVKCGVSSEEQQAARLRTDCATNTQFTRKTSTSKEKIKRPMSNIARLCRGTSKGPEIDINCEIIKAKVVAPNESIFISKADSITPLCDNSAIRKMLRTVPRFPISLPSKVEWKEKLLRMAYLWILQKIKAFIREVDPVISDADFQSLFSRVEYNETILEKHLGQALDQFIQISLYSILKRWEPSMVHQVYGATVAVLPGSWYMEDTTNSAVGKQKRKLTHHEEYARPTKQQKTSNNHFDDLPSSMPFATQLPIYTNQEISLRDQINVFFKMDRSTSLTLEHVIQRLHEGHIAEPFIKELPNLLNRTYEICLKDSKNKAERLESNNESLPGAGATGKSNKFQASNGKFKTITDGRSNCKECGREQPLKKLANEYCAPCNLKHLGDTSKSVHCGCDPNVFEVKAGCCIKCGKARMVKKGSGRENANRQGVQTSKSRSMSLQTSEEPENGKRSTDATDAEDRHSSKKMKAAAISTEHNSESFVKTIASSKQERMENIMRRLKNLSKRSLQRDFGIDLPRPYVVPKEQIEALGLSLSFYPGVEPELQKAAGVSFSRKKSTEEIDKLTNKPMEEADATIMDCHEETETSFFPLPQTTVGQVIKGLNDNNIAQQHAINDDIPLDQTFPTQVSYSIGSDIPSSLPWPTQTDTGSQENPLIVTKSTLSQSERQISKRPKESEKIAQNYYQEPLVDSDDDDSDFVPEDVTTNTPPKADEIKDVQRPKFSFTESMHNQDSVFAMRQNSVEVQKEVLKALEPDNTRSPVQVDQTSKDSSPLDPPINNESQGAHGVHGESDQDNSKSEVFSNSKRPVNEDLEVSQSRTNELSEIQVLETPMKLSSHENPENGKGADIDRNGHTSHAMSSQHGTGKSDIGHISASFSTESGSASHLGNDTQKTQQSVIDLTSKSASNDSPIAIEQEVPVKLCKEDVIVPREIARTDLLQVAQYVGTLPVAQINALTEIDPENITEEDTNKFQQDFRSQWFQRRRLAKASLKEDVKIEVATSEVVDSIDTRIERTPTSMPQLEIQHNPEPGPEPELESESEPEPQSAPESASAPASESPRIFLGDYPTSSDDSTPSHGSFIVTESEPESDSEPEPALAPPAVILSNHSTHSDDSTPSDNSFIATEFQESLDQAPVTVTRDIHGMDVFSSEIDIRHNLGMKGQISSKEDSPEPIDYERLKREEIVAKLSRGISIADRKKRIDDLQKELDEEKANFKPSKEVDIFSWTLF